MKYWILLILNKMGFKLWMFSSINDCFIPFWGTKLGTRESDVETLVGNGKVGQKADLSCVVPKQACAERRGQCGARQPPERLREASILCYQ